MDATDPLNLEPPPTTRLGKLKRYIENEATFFRVHLAAFVFIPLICSGIFYGCNGRIPVSYVDSLFLCYSAMTVTGLSTVNLSTITAWQQVMLYLLMMLGDITTVSWIMVLVRKSYFRRKCEYVFENTTRRRRFRSRTAIISSISNPGAPFKFRQSVDPAPLSAPALEVQKPTPGSTFVQAEKDDHDVEKMEASNSPEPMLAEDARTFTSSPKAQSTALSPVNSRISTTSIALPHAHFALPDDEPSRPRQRRKTTIHAGHGGPPLRHRTATILTPTAHGHGETGGQRKYEGLGGFPGPFELLHKFAQRTTPGLYKRLERKMTMPYTSTITGSQRPYFNFDLIVGRNSDFHTETLSDEEVEQIGGVEYKALRLLSYLVPAYFIGTQLFSFLLFAPWISTTSTYDDIFAAQPRLVAKPWFALFQVMGSYTGGGMSLVDLGMVPFQKAYLMIFAMMFSILAGNHALPIFLRFVIWIGSRLSSAGSYAEQAFSFLLDHPRRCFIYLFPSHQTWFLLICLVGFSIVELVLFDILNIDLPVYEELQVGTKILLGLFQGLAARASGFSIVALANVAPALQFLYVVMMYIAIYPVAISIRSTNVYEERSLGVFEAPVEDEEEEPSLEPTDLNKLEPRQRVGRYVAWHLRRQLTVDIWWLVWGVFLVLIIERNNLMDEDKKWFDVFRVLFELVSAFGGIGLSLGFPDDNYSFAGAFRTLSKLVVIVIMIRGRHRGLPVAVDRAVLLPHELQSRQNESSGVSSGATAVGTERTSLSNDKPNALGLSNGNAAHGAQV